MKLNLRKHPYRIEHRGVAVAYFTNLKCAASSIVDRPYMRDAIVMYGENFVANWASCMKIFHPEVTSEA
jgi:hypothetical protein